MEQKTESHDETYDSDGNSEAIQASISDISTASLDRRISSQLWDTINIKQKHYCKYDTHINALHKCEHCHKKVAVALIQIARIPTKAETTSLINLAVDSWDKTEIITKTVEEFVQRSTGDTGGSIKYMSLEKQGIVCQFWYYSKATYQKKLFQRIIRNHEVVKCVGAGRKWYESVTAAYLDAVLSKFAEPIYLIAITEREKRNGGINSQIFGKFLQRFRANFNVNVDL